MRAVERRWLAVGDLLAVTAVEDHLWCALDEQQLLAILRLVERCHELVLRLKRDGVDTGKRRLFGLPIHAQLGRKRIERPLGRIALHLPSAFLSEQLRIIA